MLTIAKSAASFTKDDFEKQADQSNYDAIASFCSGGAAVGGLGVQAGTTIKTKLDLQGPNAEIENIDQFLKDFENPPASVTLASSGAASAHGLTPNANAFVNRDQKAFENRMSEEDIASLKLHCPDNFKKPDGTYDFEKIRAHCEKIRDSIEIDRKHIGDFGARLAAIGNELQAGVRDLSGAGTSTWGKQTAIERQGTAKKNEQLANNMQQTLQSLLQNLVQARDAAMEAIRGNEQTLNSLGAARQG
jgi:uncharacterized protein YukE